MNFIEWLEALFNSIFAPTPIQPPEPIMPIPTPQEPIQPIPAPVVPVVSHDPTNSLSELGLWCKAAIQMEGANPAHNNPGNIRYVQGTWMAKIAIGQSNGFCVFKDYATGYAVLQKFFVNAATGLSDIYHPTDTLYVFYSKYAPASDNNDPKHYAEFVASVIGVSPTVQIKSLV